MDSYLDQKALPFPIPEECKGEIDVLEYSCRRESQLVRWGPPDPPGREVWAYSDGDDEPHYVRDCTEEEIAEREADFAKAMQQWRDTQGLARTHGPVVHECTVRMVGGRYYRLLGGSEGWHVVEAGFDS